VLDVPRRAPSLAALTELTAAHLTRVPFENVSKLLRFRQSGFCGIPTLAEFLDRIERHRLGGTCYSNNSHLNRLLEALGYQAFLCGADMKRPNVHVVNRVRLEGRD
jgi:arylamine N-acetyltransferase